MPLLFVQNTKNLGSMARYTDSEFMEERKDSAPNYTVGQNNTFTKQLNRGAFKRGESVSDEFRSNQESEKSSGSNSDGENSESLDSQTNILDLEADAEYDHNAMQRSRGDSFEIVPEDSEAAPNSLTNSPEVKKKEDKNLQKKRKRVATVRAKKQEEKKTLTFVDMSHLSFLSKSVSQANQFKQQNHQHKPVVLPKDTKVAIEEDLSEEDYESEDEQKDQQAESEEKPELTVQGMINELFEQILKVVFEAHDPEQIYKYDIVDNSILKGNMQNLHKQMFVKEKSLPTVKKEQKTFNKDAFKQIKKVVRKLPEQPKPSEPPQIVSKFSEILDAQDPDAFIIQPPDKKSKLYLETKIYFWETPASLKIKISSTDITFDVIRHIMTLYKQNAQLQKEHPMQHADPNRYQLWLIDEYDRRNKYRPDEEMGPRPMRDPIGEFQTLAFVENKNFKPSAAQGQSLLDEQIQRELEAQGFRQIKVQISNHF